MVDYEKLYCIKKLIIYLRDIRNNNFSGNNLFKNECADRDQHIIGDLLWAKIGHYPFWPCMVSYDPNMGCYTKLRKVRNREERIYHVQYFGKQVQHGWTTPGSTFSFEGEERFHMRKRDLLDKVTTISDRKKVIMKYSVSPAFQKLWQIAVKEAERALAVNPLERFETFVFKYEVNPQKLPLNGVKHHKKLAVNGVKHHKKLAVNSVKHHKKLAPYGVKHHRKLTLNGSVSIKKDRRFKGETSKQPLKRLKMLSNNTEANICRLCELENVDITCAGTCRQAFHKDCLGLIHVPEGFKCLNCERGLICCCICKKAGDSVTKCSKCSNHYHEACVKKYESANIEKKICPAHICLSCSNENPKNLTFKAPLTHCFRCPSVFHAKPRCFPVGCVALTASVLICPDHFLGRNKVSPQPICNVSYCTICAEGGELICCESCPNSYHVECIDQEVPSGDFFCEGCTKKQNLFLGMIVWAKTGSFRWWPAEIMAPEDLPANLKFIEEHDGEFPLQYFGTYEFFWTHRGRVIPYAEHHKTFFKKKSSKPSKLLEKFHLSLEEASEAYDSYVQNRYEERYLNGSKPDSYKHIKVNRPVPPAQIMYLDTASALSCSCDPHKPNPCSSDTCLNRSMLMECHPDVCRAKESCENQKFQKRQYACVKTIKTKDRGWGLESCKLIKKGSFVIEYVGEIITHEEYRRRVVRMREENIINYYFLYLDSRRMIDAGPRGNLSRFINHSCDPNCEMVKWSVNGDARIGIFALSDIQPGEELTFNYQFDSMQFEQRCNCGARNCQGIIGKIREKHSKKK